MQSPQVFFAEIRRLLSKRFTRIALAVVAIVPLLYGALYLWAFWDPYGRLDRIPVALVNEDVPVVVDGEQLHAGADLVDKLQDRHVFAWHEVSQREAQAGLQSRRYYMSLRIPAGFSEALGTADTDHPHKAELLLQQREATNMLASQIGGRVFAEIRAAAAVSASRNYYDHMLVGFSDAHDSISDAAKGAKKLSDGLADAKSGAKRLASGADSAKSGAGKLATGNAALANGAKKLSDGAGSLDAGAGKLATGLKAASSGASKLHSGTQQVATGASSLHDGAVQLETGAHKASESAHALAQGAEKVDAGVATAADKTKAAATAAAQVSGGTSAVVAALEAYVAAHPEAASDPALAKALGAAKQTAAGATQLAGGLSGATGDFTALAQGAHAVSAGSSALSAGIGQLASGASSLADGSSKLAAAGTSLSNGSAALASGVGAAAKGASSVSDGSGKLASGTKELASGAKTAASGSKRLYSGLRTLSAGTHDLSSGLSPAVSGSSKLAKGLRDGAKDIPAMSASERDANTEMMSDPVALDTTRIDPVKNYGTGFAPYFVPLSLWVGAMLIFFVVAPFSESALKGRARSAAVAFGSYLPAALLGVIQTVVLLIVLRFGLGLSPKSAPALYGFAILASLVFVAILQWLSSTFGLAGRFLAIVLLMLQLTSSAGTFPIETVPGFFRAINPWLPMTYAVEGLRQVISGGDFAVAGHDALVLLLFGIVAVVLSIVSARLAKDGRLALASLEP